MPKAFGLYVLKLFSEFLFIFVVLFILQVGISNYFEKDLMILDVCISLVPSQEAFTGHESRLLEMIQLMTRNQNNHSQPHILEKSWIIQ